MSSVDIEKQMLILKVSGLETFMVKVCKMLKCLPSFADPGRGNSHVIARLDALLKLEAANSTKPNTPKATIAVSKEQAINFATWWYGPEQKGKNTAEGFDIWWAQQ